MLDIIKEYSTKKIELLKMEATEKASITVGSVAFIVSIAIAAIFFLILFTIGSGLLIGFYLGNYAWGVLIMAGFYLLIILILFIIKKSFKMSIADKIIRLINN